VTIKALLPVLSRGLYITMALAALIVAATFWLGWRSKTDDEWVSHTLEVRADLIELLSTVQSAETGQRGYLLTGQDLYLGPYQIAQQRLPALLDRTQDLISDNPQQQQSLDHLRNLIQSKLVELGSTIDAYQAGKRELALTIVNSGGEFQLMAEIRRAIDTMQAEEVRLLAARQASAQRSALLLEALTALTFVLICAIGILTLRFTQSSVTALEAARDQLQASNTQLHEQIAQRERAESQLRQAQKIQAIGQLTGGIAHDFNNMLGAIMGAVDLASRRLAKGDFDIQRFLGGAMEAAGRAAALTTRLLAFARQQPLTPQPLDVNKMIGNMAELLRTTLGEQIKIETVAAAGLWTINADAAQLENAILNVAINARDAMPDGGQLTIETGNAYLDEAYCRQHSEIEPGQYAMIAITDTGAGMTADVIARAFDPFFTTKDTGKGTGLGLSQVYGFVKQSNGHIKIYSERGAGTTVKMYFPRLIKSAQEVGRLPLGPVRGGDSSEVILLVEDDPLVRRSTAETLNELGYTVYDSDCAANALAVLDRIAQVKLLFTDVVMPDMNGRQLATEARRRRPALKVLFTTGYTANAIVHGGILDSDVQFISKPFTLDQLAAKVRAVLDE
jgi:signal transduction histidine kinase/CheY-like chemotaxis protein